ncbi:amidohydrolase [Microbulbifer sp. ANSA001]|uniref:amidohydrolase n=1 Tax=Microbulbifer sp. ANSA001 TaxID=3243358 RepID=UPI004041C457
MDLSLLIKASPFLQLRQCHGLYVLDWLLHLPIKDSCIYFKKIFSSRLFLKPITFRGLTGVPLKKEARMKRLVLILYCFSLLSCGEAIPQNSSSLVPAQLILENAYIYTLDKSRSVASAMVIRDGYIVYIGDAQGAKKYIGPDTKVENLQGKLILPGFIQGAKIAGSAFGIDLHAGNTVDDYRRAVEVYIQENPDQQVVVGSGWRPQAFSDHKIHKEILDQINDLIPIILVSADGTSIWTNSEGLAAAGIDNDTKNPLNGFIAKNEDGIAIGLLRGRGATELLQKLIPDKRSTDYHKDILRINSLAPSWGVTTLYETNTPLVSGGKLMTILDKFSDLEPLDLRVRSSFTVLPDMTAAQFRTLQALTKRYSGEDFRIGSVSISTPVSPNAVGHSSETGKLPAIIQLVERANIHNFPVQLYVHNRVGTELALGVLLQLGDMAKKRNPRNSIFNATIADADELQKFAKGKIVAVVHPSKIPLQKKNFNVENSKHFFPEGVTLVSGYVLSSGRESSPLFGIQSGVERNIPLEVMLETFTINGAYAHGLESETGSLEKDKWADFIVLDRNLFQIPVSEIHKANILRTYYKGRLVYEFGSDKLPNEKSP